MNRAEGKSRRIANVTHGMDNKELAPPANGGPCCGSSGPDGNYKDHCATFNGKGGSGNKSDDAVPPSKSLLLIPPPLPPPPHNTVGLCPPPHVALRCRCNRDRDRRDNDDTTPRLALPRLVGGMVLILLLVVLLLFSTNVVIPPSLRRTMLLPLLPLWAVRNDCSGVLYGLIK